MEQNIVYCQVKDQYIIGSGQVVGAVGSHDDVLLRLDFSKSPSWRGLLKRCVWTDALGENPTPVLLTDNLLAEGQTEIYLCPVPGEAKTAEGMCLLTIEGIEMSGEQEIVKMATQETEFKVLPSRLYIPPDKAVTPDQAQQLQAAIDTLKVKTSSQLDAHKTDPAAHQDIRDELKRVDDKQVSFRITGDALSPYTAYELKHFWEQKRQIVVFSDWGDFHWHMFDSGRGDAVFINTEIGQFGQPTAASNYLIISQDRSWTVHRWDHNSNREAHQDIRDIIDKKLMVVHYVNENGVDVADRTAFEITYHSTEGPVALVGGKTPRVLWHCKEDIDGNAIFTDTINVNGVALTTYAKVMDSDAHIEWEYDDHNKSPNAHQDIRDSIGAKIAEHNESYSSHKEIRDAIQRNTVGISDNAIAIKQHGNVLSEHGAAITNHTSSRNNPHGVTYVQTGADKAGAATEALNAAKNYTNKQIAALPAPEYPVVSVNGKTGAVHLAAGDVGAMTADAGKQLSDKVLKLSRDKAEAADLGGLKFKIDPTDGGLNIVFEEGI